MFSSVDNTIPSLFTLLFSCLPFNVLTATRVISLLRSFNDDFSNIPSFTSPKYPPPRTFSSKIKRDRLISQFCNSEKIHLLIYRCRKNKRKRTNDLDTQYCGKVTGNFQEKGFFLGSSHFRLKTLEVTSLHSDIRIRIGCGIYQMCMLR